MRKINYENEARIFLKIKASGQKVSQKSYCHDRSNELGQQVSLAYFRKILATVKKKPRTKSKNKPKNEPKCQPYDWPAMRAEFMGGDFPSLSAFARSKGISPTSTSFRKMTAGWLKEKNKVGAILSTKIQDKLIDGQVAEKFQDIYAKALIFQAQLFELWGRLAHTSTTWAAAKTPSQGLETARFLSEMQKTFERLIPNIKGLEKLSDVNAVFDQLQQEKIDVPQAAIEITKMGVRLPKPMEIMLSRHQPAEPEPDDADMISDDAIIARRQELLAEIEQERVDVVADRKKYVADLKKQMKAAGSDAWGDLPDYVKITIN